MYKSNAYESFNKRVAFISPILNANIERPHRLDPYALTGDLFGVFACFLCLLRW